jgi:superfamily I DNA/RNA helicase
LLRGYRRVWIHCWAPHPRHKLAIVSDQAIDQLLREARGDLDPSFDAAFLRGEWDAVIDFWGIKSWEQYRHIPRTGRGIALSRGSRRRLWETLAEVRRRLVLRKLNTFGDVCDRLRVRIETDGRPPFGHIVVDEAQDLGPRELKLVAALATPGPRALFFAGDVGQRIFRWPFPWLAAGIDVRGRSQRLKVNYRTSEEIRLFSDRLLPVRIMEVDGATEERGALSLLRGPEPELKGAPDLTGEIAILTSWIAAVSGRGVSPGEVAIFARTRRALQECAEPALSKLGLSAAWLSADQDTERTSITLGTLHSAKGLEFKAVAVVACAKDQLPLAAAVKAAKNPETRRVIEDRELSLLYVGCTRARDQLLVTWSGEPSRFLGLLKKE